MNNKYKSLFSDTASFAVSNFASKILTFLLIPLYTSVLSTNDYGVADLITNTINVIYPIITLNIMESTLRFAFEKDVSKDDVLGNSLIFVLISEVILVAVTPIVSFFSDTMYKHLVWFSVIFLGYNIQQILSQYVKGIGKTKIFAVSGVVHTVVLITSNIVGLLVLRFGLNAYLFSIAIGFFFTSIYLIVGATIKIRVFRINWPLMKDMLKFSVPTIPNNIAWWVSTSADKYVIIGYLGIAASGIYSVAYKIPSILTLLSNIFTSAWTISVIQNVDDKDGGKFQSTVYKYFNVGNVLACSALILLAQFLGKILFANDFYIAWRCVPFLLVAYVFSGLAGFFASSFRAVKYTKGLFNSTFIGAIANIVLNFFFVDKFGIMGAAFTTMIGFAITFYIRSHTVKKITDISFNLKKDTFAYLALVIQAFVICMEVPFSYLIGIVFFVLLFLIYRNECCTFIGRVLEMAKRFLQKHSRQGDRR